MNRARVVRAASPLDLTPILGLVAILIPLLLMAYRPAELAMVDTVLPAICAADCTTGGEDPRVVTPALQISTEGYVLTGLSEVPGLVQVEAGRLVLPCLGGTCAGGEGYDTEGLTRTLTLAKDAYPDSQNITLVPDGHVAYAAVIQAMDASREVSREALAEAGRPLFPYTTVAGGTP